MNSPTHTPSWRSTEFVRRHNLTAQLRHKVQGRYETLAYRVAAPAQYHFPAYISEYSEDDENCLKWG